MERRIEHCLALAVAVIVLVAAHTAAAQYMYLDANGDGVHTSADVVPASGSATFDIWLKTDENRDGSRPVCSRDSTSALTINSYTFLLRVRNGTVTWSNFVNRMPTAGGPRPRSFRPAPTSWRV